ncbi:MAG: Hpt domain-containing protein, partial [Gammaproteobacteria bacterium]|nr:Hpt domain-containing protein [Gammaproteobacteria bacterium]
IRNELGLTKLPILAMTANAMEGDRQLALAAGMNDHIAKPLNITTMFSTMAKWFAPVAASGTGEFAATAELRSSIDLPHIAGLDAEHGLRCTMHQPELYRRMLRKFMLSNKNIIGELEQSLRQQDYALLGRLAHTLKGNAGTIGALPLADVAAEIEKQLQHAEETALIADQILRTEQLLNPLLLELEQFFAEAQPKTSTPQLNLPHYDWTVQLRQLLTLLENCDTSAIAEVEALEQLPLSNAQFHQLDQLKQLISGFQFENAEQLLQSILAEHHH